MKFNAQNLLAGLTLAGLMAGCATTTPPQLVEARAAYTTSSSGLAAKLTPTELYDAKKVLDKANKEFDENGDTPVVRDYSYIAKRKIELADVKARTELDRQRIGEAQRLGVKVREDQFKSATDALAKTREQLDAEKANVATEKANVALKDKDLEATSAQLEAEKQARLTAEAKLAGAMKDLATIAAVKEEARGLVITLSGSVLFASGKYALLETAKVKLNQVAEALKAQNPDKKMIVEGHTDSMGSEAVNQPLSLNRANSVREYLVGQGVDGSKITAVGLSSSRPLLDNRTAENRANNRRVEIIIQPAQVSAL